MKKILVYFLLTFAAFAQGVYIRNAFPDGLKVDTTGAIDVYLQDQTTKEYIQRFGIENDTTWILDTVATVDSYKLVLDKDGFGGGDFIKIIKDGSDPTFYCGKVMSVSGDTITLDSPINFPYDSGTVVYECFNNMNYNGSSTPRSYFVDNKTTNPIDINKISIYISDNAEMDDGKFGAVTALARGVTMRIKRANGTYEFLGTVRTNGELSLFSSGGVNYSAKSPAGTYGLYSTIIFNGQEHTGIAIRLQENERIEIIVKDDLSGLLQFQAIAIGHFTQD